MNYYNVQPDPVYLDDAKVFENLILKERQELNNTAKLMHSCSVEQRALNGQTRHYLLSWMLRVCEHQMCQDEIFPLATMILDKFLLFYPLVEAPTFVEQEHQHEQQQHEQEQFFPLVPVAPYEQDDQILAQHATIVQTNGAHHHQQVAAAAADLCMFDGLASDDDPSCSSLPLYCNEHWTQLKQRQLCLFAACSLLLATKMRQTPRLCVQTLIEFSRLELPVELARDEILDGELLVLATLKWDLAALVTPNDYLTLLVRKCSRLVANYLVPDREANHQQHQLNTTDSEQVNEKQTLLLFDDARQQRLDTETAPTTTTTTRPKMARNNNYGEEEDDDDDNDETLNRNNKVRRRETMRCTKEDGRQQQQKMRARCLNKCDESRMRRHTQTLLELCLMDAQLSRVSPSILAMSTMAVAIDGLSMTNDCWRLDEIVRGIHESTDKVNELKQMIEVSYRIEEYVQRLFQSIRK